MSNTPALAFEPLETRSMMAAHPAADVSADLSVHGVGLHASLAKEDAAATTLAAPTLSVRALSPEEARLTWTAVDNAVSYRLERMTGRTREWKVVGTTTDLSAVSSKLHGDRLYRYHVVAVDAQGNEAASEIVAVRPNAALAHAAARAEKIATTIESFRDQQTQFVADNTDNLDDPMFRRQFHNAQHTFADQMADMGVSYRPVSVEALLPVGSLNALPKISSTPPTVTVAVRNSTELNVTWTAVTGGLAYKIERSNDSGTTWNTVAFSTALRFVDVGLTPDTTYQYRATVFTSSDTSAASAAASGTTNPVSPTSLAAATTNDTTIALSWSTVANATSYKIERSTNLTAWTALTPGTPLTGSDTSYSDNTATAGTTYYYRITTVNGSRLSAASDPVAATTKTAAPTLTATPVSGTRVNLSWTAQATAFEYTIARSDDAGTTWTDIGTSSVAHYVDAGLTPNSDYQYRVTATNAGGISAASSVQSVTTLLATVSNFTATAATDADKVTLGWDAVTDADSYTIERSTDQSTWTALTPGTPLDNTSVSYEDTTVTPGLTYYYRIIATNSNGNGARGDAASALVRPGTPTGLSTTLTAPDTVTISWTGVTGAASYKVEKSTDSGSTWTTVGTPSGTNITDTGLASNTDLQYRVSAVNTSGASDVTSVSSITSAPATPTGFAASFDGTNNKNTLTWSAVTEADTYVIERSVDNGAWTTLSTSLAGSDSSYEDTTGITPGTSYRYRISSTNANGTSPVSGVQTVLTEPAVPTLTATAASATSVTASWTASASATAYTLQYSDDAGSTWNTVYTGANTTYTKTGLTADTAYQFQVLATNGTGDSDYSTAASVTTALDAPANFAVTSPNGSSAVLAWDATTHADGYKIERSADNGTTWTVVTPATPLTGTDVTYTDTGLTANTAYKYRLSANNSNGTGTATAATAVTTRVAQVTGLTATTTSATALALSWPAVAGATSYKIETSTDAGTTWSDLVVSQSTLTYNNTGLTANTSYQYRVTASNTNGAGVVSAVATGKTLMTAPTGFTAAAASNGSVTLAWSSNSDATGWKIERSANAGTTWTVVTPATALAGTATGYTDSGLTGNTPYQYRLSVIGSAGTSAPTTAASVTTRTAAPVANGTVVSGTQVNLTWAAVSGATSYTAQKSVDNGTTWTSAGTASTTSLSVTGLTTNTPYLFRVYAVNAGGSSAASNSVSLRTMLGAPANLATTAVNATSIALSWNPVAGATTYKLEKAVGTGAWTTITPATAFTGSTAAYTDTGLTAGTNYKYRISAINTLGTSVASSELAVVTKPVAPVVTATTASTTQINLTWPAVASATSYKVELSGDGGTTWSTAGTPATNSYNATGLTADSGYSFRVSAINASGTGAASSVVNTRTLLTAPTGLSVLDAGSTTITLSWNQSDNATSYVIERSANAGSTWTTLTITPALAGGDTSYTDTGLTGGSSYVYRLSATNAAGKSAASSTVTGVTLPAAPTLTATPASGTSVSLSWTASATATSYRVERSSNAGATWSTIASPTGTSFTDTGLAAAHNYVYRVSAVNASGVGDTSTETNVATLLAAPTGLSTTTLSATSMSLAWTAPTGATGYKIERSTDTNTWTTLTQSPVLAGTATYFTNTGLTAGTDYYYRITALGSGTIVSPTSSIVRGTTTLAAPTGLAVSGTSTSAVTLTWTNVTNYTRTGFKLQRSATGTSGWTTVVSNLAATATSYSNTGLTSGTKYYYRLVAVNLAGDSAPSSVVNATTK